MDIDAALTLFSIAAFAVLLVSWMLAPLRAVPPTALPSVSPTALPALEHA